MKKTYKSFTYLFGVLAFISFNPCNSYPQFQISTTGSTYGLPLNRKEIYYNPYGEKSSYYERSQYFSLGAGYKLSSGLYFGLELSSQKLLFTGSSFNAFGNQPLSSNYKLHNYGNRIGLRTSYSFFNSNKFKPFVSGSVQLVQDWFWREKGTRSFLTDGEIREEDFKATHKRKDNNIYYDLRIGLEYCINEHLSLAISAEFSTGLVNPFYNNHGSSHINEGRVQKHEFARPFSIKYLF